MPAYNQTKYARILILRGGDFLYKLNTEAVGYRICITDMDVKPAIMFHIRYDLFISRQPLYRL